MKNKKCNICNKILSLSEFDIRKIKKQNKSGLTKTYIGYKWACKNCVKIFYNNYGLKRYFNISKQEKQKIMKDQNYKCILCEKDITIKNHIDHDHKTGKIRGILCPNCNQGLGNFNDNINALKKAIKYLS